MDSINPWIDLGETRRMAERLMATPRDPEVKHSADDILAGFPLEIPDDGGFAESVKAAPPAVGHPVARPATTPGIPDQDEVHAGARAKTREAFHALAIMMVDRGGQLLFSEGPFDAFHFALRDLAAATDTAPVARRLKVGASASMEAIPVLTDQGTHWLGVVLPKAAAPGEVERIHHLWISAQSIDA